MTRHRSRSRIPDARHGAQSRRGWAAAVAAWLVCTAVAARAQTNLPPEAIDQFNHAIGGRVEAVIILGGDYGAAGGFYTFRGGEAANVSVAKVGGGGPVTAPRPIGTSGFAWAPVLQGNLGHITAENVFPSGYLQGNKSVYDVLAVQGGGGVRFSYNDHFSLTPAVSGIYGHTENEFKPQNSVGDAVKAAAAGTFVDWKLDSWSVMPSLELGCDWTWGRSAFEFRSRYAFYHTESFAGSSPVIRVQGDSHTLENKLDVDVPLGWKILGSELHTGGFFARTELFGGAADGLNENHVYTVNGRLVADLLGRLWKLKWLGLGASYFFGDHVQGWSAGADLRLEF